MDGHGQAVSAAIESMNGTRFVNDQLELAGWGVQIPDAQEVKGLAPLAAKTDKVDAWVIAALARRELVPAIWLARPDEPRRARAGRFRLNGRRDDRGPAAKNGPKSLRWALIEDAARHHAERERYERTKRLCSR